eukprot:TRINITY_DN5564_c0_g1_i14.p1 TRINITY_DN5564_c0_g1~~TRINITY_DN5564_c0_g1_i14.p1  ORF type:complete len:770 (+),score=113.33 TRINITY_DN5564_c0_g1_i14:289-2598(+)
MRKDLLKKHKEKWEAEEASGFSDVEEGRFTNGNTPTYADTDGESDGELSFAATPLTKQPLTSDSGSRNTHVHVCKRRGKGKGRLLPKRLQVKKPPEDTVAAKRSQAWSWRKARKKVAQSPKSSYIFADIDAMRKMGPYLWPSGKWDVKMRIIFSLLLLVVGKAFAVLTPVTYKYAVDTLANNPYAIPWHMVFLYGALRWLSSVSVDLKDVAFIKVSQGATKEASLDTFRHLHRLSLDYHINHQIGEVVKALERGTRGISVVLSMMLFNILPTFIEVIFVCAILVWFYEFYFTLLTIITIIGYILFTLILTDWTTGLRRYMVEKDTKAANKAIDSLLNFETVKHYCNEKFEKHRYAKVLNEKMDAYMANQFSLAYTSIGQTCILVAGVMAVMIIAAQEVVTEQMTVGDFVLVNTYLIQLYQPLSTLGGSYKLMKQAAVDMEAMFDAILGEKITIQDSPNASELDLTEGHIVFDNVTFSFGEVNIIKTISFEIPSGQTIAIVGPTGSGKSTISRLLYRLYDIDGGSITIDGQNIKGVTQKSLRRNIGIVPQECMLFNESIYYNIAYGKDDATAEEIYHAAGLARIHDFILSLPDGYRTKVGERGLRLSGGEKQRVAIARAILKDPDIMVFDEATSALDNQTEKEIQAALNDVSTGKTTVIVAHRLSTIIDADQILVLRKGEIVERGSHDELLQLKGEYYNLWIKQLEQGVTSRTRRGSGGLGSVIMSTSSAEESPREHSMNDVFEQSSLFPSRLNTPSPIDSGEITRRRLS